MEFDEWAKRTIPVENYGLDDDDKDAFLDESLFTVTSQPYISVTLLSRGINGKDEKRFQISRNVIQSASIQGKTPVSRKGEIKLVDPDGELPDLLTRLGAESNSWINAKFHNIEVSYGWMGLRSKDGRSSAKTATVRGLILKTAFDITDDGVTMVSIQFQETALSVLDTIRIFHPDDIMMIFHKGKQANLSSLDEVSADDSGKSTQQKNVYYRGKKVEIGNYANKTTAEMSVGEKLNWLCGPDSGLQFYTDSIERSKIELYFEATDDSGEDSELNVGFGEFLMDKINELTSKAKKLNGEDKVNYVYERLFVGPKQDEPDTTVIIYGWKATPDESNTAPQNTMNNMDTGPVLAWKRVYQGSKQILEWGSDLNSKTHLIHQGKDELTQKMNKFKEEDVASINASLQEGGQAELNKESSAGWWIFGDSQDEADKKNEIKAVFRETLQALSGELASTQNSQLRAILDSNVFKGNAKIIGDPTIGDIYAPWQVKFKTDFSALGDFGSIFGERTWALTNVTHEFSPGQYFTNLELMTYPPPVDEGIESPSERADSSNIGVRGL